MFFNISPFLLMNLIVFIAIGCSNSTAPVVELEQEIHDDYRWTNLGLKDSWISAVKDTPWGLFAGTQTEGIFKFNEETNQWTSLGLDHGINSGIVFADSDEPKILVGISCCLSGQKQSTPAAVFASKDKGREWIEWDGGLAQKYDEKFWASVLIVDSENPDRIYFGQDTYQLLASENGGENWSFFTGDYNNGGGQTLTITLSPQRDGRMWFGGYTAFDTPIIYRSDNWGREAETVYHSNKEGGITKIVADSQDPDRLWMAESGRIAESSDAGENWSTILAPAMGPDPENVLFYGLLKDSDTLYAAGARWIPQKPHEEYELRLYKSMDEGVTWDTLAVPARAVGARGLQFDRNKRLLIPTARGLWRVD